MVPTEQPYLRIVRDPEPLGCLIRPLSRDFKVMTELMAAGRSVATSVILDGRKPEKSADLREMARSTGVEIILDPTTVELSTIGGFVLSGMSSLPWAEEEPDTPDTLAPRVDAVAEAMAQRAIEMRVDAVLAPSHYLESAPSPWLEVDLRLTRALRRKLRETPMGRRVRIYYPLVSRLSELTQEPVRARIALHLSELAAEGVIDAVFLRMHAFGTTSSGRLNLRRYIQVTRHFHAIGLPLVAERTGTVGLPLLALGCVAGVESGVTLGERCDIRRLQREPKRGSDKPEIKIPLRVYIPAIGAFLNRKPAAEFFAAPGIKNWFACQDVCCREGHVDMLKDPRRHFLITRSKEVLGIGQVPESIRVDEYLDRWLRPATDRVIRATRALPALQRHRERLNGWRETVSEVQLLDRQSRPTVSPNLFTKTAAERSPSGLGSR